MDERPTTPAADAAPYTSPYPYAAAVPSPTVYGYTVSAPFTLREAVRIIRRRAKLVFLTFAITVAAAIAVTAMMKPVYTASTTVLLDDSPAPVGGNPSLKDLLNSGMSASLDTEIEKIKSRTFLSGVLSTLQKGHKTKITYPEQLGSTIEISSKGGDKILNIGVKAGNPQEAVDIADAVANGYVAFTRAEADERADRAKRRLKLAQQRAKVEKEAAEKDYYTFLREVGVSDPGSLYQRRAQKTLDVYNQLEDQRKNLLLAQEHQNNLRNQLAHVRPEVVAGYSLDKNTKINDYQALINDLEKDRAIALRDFGPESEEIQDFNNKIEAYKKQLEAVKQSDVAYSRGNVTMSRNSDYASLVTGLIGAERDVQETRQNIAQNERLLARLESEQKRLAPQSARYQELLNRVTNARDAYQKTRLGEVQIDINQRTNSPDVQVLDTARIDPTPVSPKSLLNGIMAVFLGAFLGIGLAIFAEYMSGGGTPEEVGGIGPVFPALPAGAEHGYSAALPRVGGVPLLAQVPVGAALPAPVMGRADGLPPAPVGAGSAAVEDAFREIGYVLAHHEGHSVTGAGREAAAAGRVPVILFAGTRSDDATASVAAQLCATLVRDGLRVTLVDADRAQPRLNRVFGAPDAPGLADVLAGRVGVKDILHIGAEGNLRFLSAGSPSDQVAEMSEGGLRALFDDLSIPTDTDLVVVNGPSVWAARQVGPLEKAADGLVLVAPDAVPPAESVARARRLLSNGYQPRILGVVVGRSVPATTAGEALASAPAAVTVPEKEARS